MITQTGVFTSFMPTRFVLALFDQADARYDASFNKVWPANSADEVQDDYLHIQNGDSLKLATRKVSDTNNPIHSMLPNA